MYLFVCLCIYLFTCWRSHEVCERPRPRSPEDPAAESPCAEGGVRRALRYVLQR